MPEFKSYVVNQMTKSICSLINDVSSDCGLKKMNATCAAIFDVERSTKVELKFYYMCSTAGENSSTAETLFETINLALRRDNLSWVNLISFGLDNCNTNMGSRNSLKTIILKENKNCFIAGCSCHLVYLAGDKGSKIYAKGIGFDMDDHQVGLFHYFRGSTRRKDILAEYIIDVVDLKWCDFTRFVST